MSNLFNRMKRRNIVLIGLFGIVAAIALAAAANIAWYFASNLLFGSCRVLAYHEPISNTLPLSPKWQFEAEDPVAFQPYAGDGMIFVKTIPSGCPPSASSQNKLIALDSKTGKKLWESSFVGLINNIAPVVLNGIVATPINADRSLRGINKDSGETEWEYPLPQYGGIIWALTNDDRYIYIGSGNDPTRVDAISPDTGQVVWERSDGFPKRSSLGVLVHSEHVYVLFAEALYILDPMTGKVEQRYELNLPTVLERFTVADNLVFLIPPEGISAVDLDSVQSIWAYNPACIKERAGNEGTPLRTGRFFLFAPTPIGKRVYATGGCHSVFALDNTSGTQVWQYNNDGVDSISQVAALDDIGYVMFSDWSIRAIDLRTGKEVGRMATQAERAAEWEVGTQGLATWDNLLHATFGDRTVYAFGQ